MLKLQAHSSNPTSDFKVEVSYQFSSNKLLVDFAVCKNPLNINKNFNQKNWDNWGLWECDVVEVFLTKHNNRNRYLELQTSAINQKFALNILEPRKEFKKITKLKTQVATQKTDEVFISHFSIDLSEIPGDEQQLYGNFHACLHHNDKTYYYSLNPNDENKPDFHRPDLFLPIQGEVNG